VGGEAWPPDPYRQAVRTGGVSYEFFFSASVGGAPTPGAQNLRPIGGQITDTTKPGVRRVLSAEFAPEPGVFDLLAPEGTTLTAICRATYQDRSSYDIPMGVFDVDTQSIEEGGGKISPDRPGQVGADPAGPVPGAASLGGWLPGGAADRAPDPGRDPRHRGADHGDVAGDDPGAGVGAGPRQGDHLDLAADIGAWVYFDRQGGAVIADIPQLGASADWLIDASATGVLVSLDRQRSRTETRNVVVVTSSASVARRSTR
jgi:hypothetical protein